MIRPETVIDVKDLNLAFGSNGFHLENIHNIQILGIKLKIAIKFENKIND